MDADKPDANVTDHGELRMKRMIVTALCALLLSACSLQPWVKPYERQQLADPIMAFERDGVQAAYLAHAQQAREGARGAEGTAGGGCGCN